MGWKTIRDTYRIKHIIQVVPGKGICIGSPYVHDLIVIRPDGDIAVSRICGGNEDLDRYLKEFRADKDKLKRAMEAQDEFTNSIKVYTYNGGTIVEKLCETPKWPNPTHDGEMQFDNTFSTNRKAVVKWAKRDAALAVEWTLKRIQDLKQKLAEAESELIANQEAVAALEREPE